MALDLPTYSSSRHVQSQIEQLQAPFDPVQAVQKLLGSDEARLKKIHNNVTRKSMNVQSRVKLYKDLQPIVVNKTVQDKSATPLVQAPSLLETFHTAHPDGPSPSLDQQQVQDRWSRFSSNHLALQASHTSLAQEFQSFKKQSLSAVSPTTSPLLTEPSTTRITKPTSSNKMTRTRAKKTVNKDWLKALDLKPHFDERQVNCKYLMSSHIPFQEVDTISLPFPAVTEDGLDPRVARKRYPTLSISSFLLNFEDSHRWLYYERLLE